MLPHARATLNAVRIAQGGSIAIGNADGRCAFLVSRLTRPLPSHAELRFVFCSVAAYWILKNYFKLFGTALQCVLVLFLLLPPHTIPLLLQATAR